MIDWSDPEPDFVKPNLGVELRTLEQAVLLLDEWIAAEREAYQAFVRMHDAYCKMKWRAENAEALAANLEVLADYKA